MQLNTTYATENADYVNIHIYPYCFDFIDGKSKSLIYFYLYQNS